MESEREREGERERERNLAGNGGLPPAHGAVLAAERPDWGLGITTSNVM